MFIDVFKKKSDTLGLDIGSRSVKIVRLTHSKKPAVSFCGMVEISLNATDFSQTLHDYLAEHHLLGLSAAACLDDPSIKIRKVELPEMPEADLKEAVKWKIRDVLEGPVSDYVVRSSLLEKVSTVQAKKLMLVGYAIKRAAVTNLLQKVTLAGLKISFVEPSSVSLAAAIEAAYPSGENWVAGLDVGPGKAVMVIVGQGKLYYSRPLPGIQSVWDDPVINQKLAAEVQNTIDTFTVTFHVDKINRIFLAGSGAALKGLAEYLTTNVAVKSEILNPFKEIDKAPDKPYLYAQALALARI